MNELAAYVVRSERVESLHVGYAAVTDVTGELLHGYGEAHYKTYVRSSAKPFQAMAVIRSGAMERFEFNLEELAVMCASHSGEAKHVTVVSRILQKLDLPPEALQCGAHMPLHKESANSLLARGEKPQPVHNNCSGKHAGMLAVARQLGVPVEQYLELDSPVQKLIYEIMQEYTGQPEIHRGIDGCSAPVFYLPLDRMARAFARLAAQETEESRMVYRAMTTHPHLVAGTGRFDTVLMEAAQGALLAKGGAEGFFGAAWQTAEGKGLGLALKVLDGNHRVVPVMTLTLLQDVGVLPPELPTELRSFLEPVLKNHAGKEIGTIIGHIDRRGEEAKET